MKKIILLVTIVTLVLSSAAAYAESNTAVKIDANLATSIKPFTQEVKVKYDADFIQYDVNPVWVDGKLMIPLKNTLDKFGYTMIWNPEMRAVEIFKGAQFSTLYIEKNSYIKNKMAPFQLSTAPIVTGGRTLVPIEFFKEVLGLIFHYENNEVVFKPLNAESTDDQLVTHSGIVTAIDNTKSGVRYSLSNDSDSEVTLIVSTDNTYTIFQKRDIAIGDSINIISDPIMLLSYPGQTGGIVVW